MSGVNPEYESNARRVLTLAGLLLVALNLRPAITSVSPVLMRIGRDLEMTATGQGFLTTLPVLFLGLAAPLAPRLARRLGPERAVLAALGVLALAVITRQFQGRYTDPRRERANRIKVSSASRWAVAPERVASAIGH